MNIHAMRKTEPKILIIGSYPVIQSILDFDYLAKKSAPSIHAIIAVGRKYQRVFWAGKEILLPVYPTIDQVPEKIRLETSYVINVTSGRRVLQSMKDACAYLPNLVGGSIFAEEVPEQHTIELYQLAKDHDIFLVGPASVGLLIPEVLKLGAIGGVDYQQLFDSNVLQKGTIAVMSSSGGVTNELIRLVTSTGHALSFALSFGGERFPLFRPMDAFLTAEKDPTTKTIVYFGELGGTDEYDLAQLLKDKKVTKPVICYIAGSVAEIFETPPQFGHAKAMAKTYDESALGKRTMLREAGAIAPDSFAEFADAVKSLPQQTIPSGAPILPADIFKNRRSALIATTVSGDKDSVATVLGEDLLTFASNHSFAAIVCSMLLGKQIKTKETEAFIDFVLRLLVDHGPYVSGAINTIITARAGRDLVSSLATGLLTIGPRFGGAINQAAANWHSGVIQQIDPGTYVEDMAARKEYIQGIGHKKYRVDLPDPRVQKLLTFSKQLKAKRFTSFALAVEKITVSKKGNLILNVDGTIAAVLMDILAEHEGYTDDQLKQLIDIEFFNALFVLSRSVGFTAHFLDQKRLDEGLFRLDENLVADARIEG